MRRHKIVGSAIYDDRLYRAPGASYESYVASAHVCVRVRNPCRAILWGYRPRLRRHGESQGARHRRFAAPRKSPQVISPRRETRDKIHPLVLTIHSRFRFVHFVRFPAKTKKVLEKFRLLPSASISLSPGTVYLVLYENLPGTRM